MKKLFTMMMVALLSGVFAVACSSDDEAESTEVSSGAEYTEDQWGSAEQQTAGAAEATQESAEQTSEAASQTADQAAETADQAAQTTEKAAEAGKKNVKETTTK